MGVKQKGVITIAILFGVICLGMTFDYANAQETVTSGEYFGVNWIYDEVTKTLTITGTGEMHDWIGDEVSDDCPWWDFNDVTENIIIGEGITHIGGLAFGFYNFAVTSVSIPDSVTSIGYYLMVVGSWKV